MRKQPAGPGSVVARLAATTLNGKVMVQAAAPHDYGDLNWGFTYGVLNCQRKKKAGVG